MTAEGHKTVVLWEKNEEKNVQVFSREREGSKQRMPVESRQKVRKCLQPALPQWGIDKERCQASVLV